MLGAISVNLNPSHTSLWRNCRMKYIKPRLCFKQRHLGRLLLRTIKSAADKDSSIRKTQKGVMI